MAPSLSYLLVLGPIYSSYLDLWLGIYYVLKNGNASLHSTAIKLTLQEKAIPTFCEKSCLWMVWYMIQSVDPAAIGPFLYHIYCGFSVRWYCGEFNAYASDL